MKMRSSSIFFFFQAEDGIRDYKVTGVQTCALPIFCLSKAISGFGLPMALLLIRPELDVWQPGEHTGTFRGNNLAFVTASEALTYREDEAFADLILKKSELVTRLLKQTVERHTEARGWVRGRGLIQGLGFDVKGLAQEAARVAFERGLIIETSGARSEVVKLLPPLTIDEEDLRDGIARLTDSLTIALGRMDLSRAAVSGGEVRACHSEAIRRDSPVRRGSRKDD